MKIGLDKPKINDYFYQIYSKGNLGKLLSLTDVLLEVFTFVKTVGFKIGKFLVLARENEHRISVKNY